MALLGCPPIQTTAMWFYEQLLRASWIDKSTNEGLLKQPGVTRILITKIMQIKQK